MACVSGVPGMRKGVRCIMAPVWPTGLPAGFDQEISKT
jgi:hypothetical protein